VGVIVPERGAAQSREIGGEREAEEPGREREVAKVAA